MSQDITMAVKMNHSCFPDIRKLAQGEPADETQIRGLLQFIDRRYDCADFRMVCILRSLYDFPHLISEDTLGQMKRTVLSFKYWMDEPGDDSMCPWSENHQLIFASCEYLAGQLYPDEIFSNNGQSGRAHMEKARKRLLYWFDTRFHLGFVEWHSNTYYEEDVAPLSLLIDCCKDTQIVRKAEMLLDLLLLDMAQHSFQGYFCASSGRCYEAQKQDPARQDVSDIMEKAFGFGLVQAYDYTKLSADFVLNRKYRVPPAIRAIVHAEPPVLVRDSMGLDLHEVAKRFPDPQDFDGRGMYLWAMEAFTNAQSIELTMDIYNAWHMRKNDFLKNLSAVNKPWLRKLRLLPLIVRVLNPVTQGIAIQRANTYTYRAKDYMLSTAQQYHPGMFGDQQHIWQATLPGGVSVFTTHPGAAFFKDNARNFSPSYWVGNGINPHAAQHENVLLCLYDLNKRKGLLEKERQWFTHAWFPADRFDEVELGTHMAIGRKGDGFIALIGSGELKRAGENELIQRGRKTGWAAVMGSADEERFAAFADRIRRCVLSLKGRTLSLSMDGRDFVLRYGKGHWVDGEKIDTDHPRIDSPFVKAGREPDEYLIRCGGHQLRLNWPGMIREIS